MNKERLEEAKKLIKHYHEQKRSNNVMLTERGVELIEHLYEQAERAQELERANKQLERQAPGIELELLNMELTDALKQNKRYREALEFYAEPKNWLPQNEDVLSLITMDYGNKARKVLEVNK